MLCESCKKRTANLHYTKIINGKVEEVHLCDICAKENQEFDLETNFPIHKLFPWLFENSQDIKQETDTKCSNCGLTFNKFKSTGKFGCANCYEDFSDKLNTIIKGIHGNNHHRGKFPKRTSPNIKLRREVEDLMKQLEEAVKKEEFEKAAIIRDEIKKVNEKLHNYEE